MILKIAAAAAVLATLMPLAIAQRSASAADLNSELRSYIAERQREFSMISAERKLLLDDFAGYIRARHEAGEPVRLNFVCTHNSRRSHMSQLWAAAAARVHGFDARTFSGGTESTAFNPRAVAAIERAGFEVVKTTEDRNPVYHVSMSDALPAMTCFSKKYDGDPNPKEGFAAIMVCTEADEACPFVPGADARFALPFVDPKVADNTDAEAATYDERCAQIAREILYAFDRAAR